MANPPIPRQQQDDTFTRDIKERQVGLDGKVDKNASITPASKAVVTYDQKGLVTSGRDLMDSDLPFDQSGGKTFGNGIDQSVIEEDGTLRFDGEASVWRDIDFPIIIRTTGPGQPVLTTLSGNITAPLWAVNDFNMGEGEEFVHEWKEGSEVFWHVHVITNGLDATDRFVRFTIEALWGNVGSVLSEINFDGEFMIPANTPNRTMLIGSIAAWTPPSGEIAAHVWPYLKRVASVGAAPTSDIFCSMLQLHVECDTAGSRNMTSK